MKPNFVLAAGLIAGTIVLPLAEPARSQVPIDNNCVYLREVSTGQRQVRKKSDIGGVGRDNRNTDFAIPPRSRFRYYIARLTPENNANYNVTVNLKYPDRTSSQVLKREGPLNRFYLVSQSFRTPTDRQPYQVNTNITTARNNAYSISILGCR